ncbi:hypothetical protein B5807_02229 [Epicoccum nigrum]|uniref:Uncharacterized protein n=1 Tax=Epicoccum nigrum TaxID=105696 RepID=A0A1Y2MAV8_EPING|nr:hypothetical protein B5807_02229 [Epicoccum nigrum]
MGSRQADRQGDRAPICALLVATVGGQRQAKAGKGRASKGKDAAGYGGSSGVGWRPRPERLARDPGFAAARSVGTSPTGGCMYKGGVKAIMQSQWLLLLRRYAGLRAQQEAAAGSACSGRCSALAVCNSENSAWMQYQGAFGATSSAVQATFGAAKSV